MRLVFHPQRNIEYPVYHAKTVFVYQTQLLYRLHLLLRYNPNNRVQTDITQHAIVSLWDLGGVRFGTNVVHIAPK